MAGVTADDHMMKVETVHCSACSVYVPALHSSVQQHLKSPDHTKGKQVRYDIIFLKKSKHNLIVEVDSSEKCYSSSSK